MMFCPTAALNVERFRAKRRRRSLHRSRRATLNEDLDIETRIDIIMDAVTNALAGKSNYFTRGPSNILTGSGSKASKVFRV